MGSSDGLNFNITPGQQMASSCTGAIITSLIGLYLDILLLSVFLHFYVYSYDNLFFICYYVLVTPLDVVKIRIQAREKEFIRNKCFLYCNGLMDHICTCNGNGNSEAASVQMTQSERVKWFKRGAPFTGTLVINLSFIHYVSLFPTRRESRLIIPNIIYSFLDFD